MKFDSTTPRVEFTISNEQFTIAVCISAGHPCTEGEAEALNQLLRENVRNNLTGKVNAGKVDFVTQEMVDSYVAGYEFGVRSTGPKRSREAIIRDEVTLAKAKAIAAKRNVKLPPAKPKTEGDVTLSMALAAVYRAHGPEIDAEVNRRLEAEGTVADTEEKLW